jgi:hypothetical protein
MVGPDQARVERDLAAGNLQCPLCGEQLRPWGMARRRKLRRGSADVELQPRRGRCRGCLVTHVLLPAVCLLRRRDLAEVIGRAVLSRALAVGKRRIAVECEVPSSTVRGWLSRFAGRAELIRAHFTKMAIELGLPATEILPASSPFADALVAIRCAHNAALSRLGPSDLWQFAASASAGLLINTSPHLPSPV